MDVPPFINIGGTCPPCPIGIDAPEHTLCTTTAHHAATATHSVSYILCSICCIIPSGELDLPLTINTNMVSALLIIILRYIICIESLLCPYC